MDAHAGERTMADCIYIFSLRFNMSEIIKGGGGLVFFKAYRIHVMCLYVQTT